MGKALTIEAGSEGVDRHLYIGGSDAAAVLNLEPYSCQRQLFLSKVPVKAWTPKEVTGPMKRGHALEEACAQVWRDETGITSARKVKPSDQQPAGAEAMARHPWLHIHPDRVMDPPTMAEWQLLGGTTAAPDGPGYLELKTMHSRMMPALDKVGVPLQHLAQVQHGLLAMGLSWGAVQITAADDWEHRRYLVTRDDEHLSAYTTTADAFWESVLQARAAWSKYHKEEDGPFLDVPQDVWDDFAPERLNVKDKRCRDCPVRHECQGQALLDVLHLPALGEEPIGRFDEDPIWGAAIAKFLTAQEIEKEAKEMKEDARAILEARMDTRQIAEGGGGRVYWRTTKSRRVDSKLLVQAFGKEAVEACKKETITRPFRVFPL